jgi:hypothetical protein
MSISLCALLANANSLLLGQVCIYGGKAVTLPFVAAKGLFTPRAWQPKVPKDECI